MLETNELTRKLRTLLHPRAALIAYAREDNSHYVYDNSYFIEVRDIDESGIMGEGRPVTAEFMNELVRGYSERHSATPYGRIPSNLLWCDPRKGSEKYIWYNSPRKRMMFFKEALKIENAEYHLPGIIYEAGESHLNVYAVGLIVFAGDAFTQLPITSDYISAKMFLSSINPSMVSTQGTAIGAAINLAARSFTPDETTDKAIILITDGENHEDDAIGAAKAAAEKGIHVNIVGMGDPKGSPIPIQGSNNYMKDKDGNVVITKLNEQMGQEIAAAGNGMYVRADNTNSALKALQKEIEKMNKTELDSKVYSEYDEQFQIFAWIALFLLIADFMTLDRKNRIFRKVKLFS